MGPGDGHFFCLLVRKLTDGGTIEVVLLLRGYPNNRRRLVSMGEHGSAQGATPTGYSDEEILLLSAYANNWRRLVSMGEHGSAQGATPTGYSEKVGVDGRAWVGTRRDPYGLFGEGWCRWASMGRHKA